MAHVIHSWLLGFSPVVDIHADLGRAAIQMQAIDDQIVIRGVVRSMLLPIPTGREEQAGTSLELMLTRLKVSASDYRAWVGLEVAKWKELGHPGSDLSRLIQDILDASTDGLVPLQRLSSSYLALHQRLADPPHGLSHDEATALLSHCQLIASLAAEDRMSASQIAAMLSARHSSLNVSWKAVQTILERLGLKPSLDMSEVQTLWEEDTIREPSDFADADVVACASIMDAVGMQLGFPSPLDRWLLTLYTPEGQKNGPFLQMLHFQCIIVEFFDHPPTWLYEFAPRGNVALWVFSQYPSYMEIAGNPVLNNAKATPRADLGWAMNRDDALVVGATALARVLLGMEEMGHAARRELAGWLRRWLLRMIRLSESLSGDEVAVDTPGMDEAVTFLLNVGRQPTSTAGIIEQRVVDAGSRLRHPRGHWQGRGLGDSVNASNISRRKLGDCDFQHLSDRRVVAYEAHGGTLTEVYLLEHLRTLRRVLELRRQEWDDQPWQVQVIFVAHGCTASLPQSAQIEDVRVDFNWIRFNEFCGGMEEHEGLLEALLEYIVAPLNQPRTPVQVRAKYRELTGHDST